MGEINKNIAPKLSSVIADFYSQGKSFLDNLYVFTTGSIYSKYIPTQLATVGLCCLKYKDLNLAKLNKKFSQEEKDATCSIVPTPLGSPGYHGIPYIFEVNGVTKLVKLNKNIVIFKPKDWGTLPPTDLRKIVKDDKLIKCWLPSDYDSTIYVSVDEFTNETLIAGMIDYVWNEKTSDGRDKYHEGVGRNNFWPYVRHESASICGENIFLHLDKNLLPAVKTNSNLVGQNLMEFCNRGDLSKLDKLKDMDERMKYFGVSRFDELSHPILDKNIPRRELILRPTIAKQILFSVIYAFHFLHKALNFTHGDAKIANIFLHKYSSTSNVAWNVNGETKIIRMELCAKLADYGKSSATFRTEKGPVRLFWEPDSEAVKLFRYSQYKVNPFIPNVSNDSYKTGSSSVNVIYNRLRMLGLPFYKSYDVYMFLVSFFLQPWAFYMLSVYPEFKEVAWNVMWKHSPESGRIVYDRIKNKIKTKYNTSELLGTGVIISILKDISLACNITKPLLDSLALYEPKE